MKWEHILLVIVILLIFIYFYCIVECKPIIEDYTSSTTKYNRITYDYSTELFTISMIIFTGIISLQTLLRIAN